MPYKDPEKKRQYMKEYHDKHRLFLNVNSRQRNKDYYEKNKDLMLAKNKKYRRENKAKINKQKRKYRTTEKGKLVMYFSKVKYKYGLTPEKYNEILVKQGGVCAICGKSQVDNKRLKIDHCHSSEKVRGFLCNNCNCLIGFADDSIEILASAIKYLSRKEEEIENSISDRRVG